MTRRTTATWDGRDPSELIDLEPLGADRFVSLRSEADAGRAVYGGQILGQVQAAAIESAADLTPNSMHARFLKAVRADAAVDYAVTHLSDGRSFRVMRVSGVQDGDLVVEATCSFRADRDGAIAHQLPPPEAVPPPETLLPLAALPDLYPEPVFGRIAQRLSSIPGLELRPCDPRGLVEPRSRPRRRYWARFSTPLSRHRAATDFAMLAFLSDFWLCGAGMMATHHHQMPDTYPRSISLDHAIWFHRRPRLDRWVLFDVDSPYAVGNIGLSRANLFGQDGTLYASVAQNGLLRPE